MTTYAWPSVPPFVPESYTWGIRPNDREFSSQFNGSVQTAEIPGTKWTCLMTFPNHTLDQRPALEAFLAKVGRRHRIAMWHRKRPQPRGSINRTGVTLAVAAAQFASQVQLTGCGANTTLLAGDMVGLPGQLLMVAEDAQADGTGAMTVLFTHSLRQAQILGAAVTLIKPTALFIPVKSALDFPVARNLAPGFTAEFIEVFA